MEQAKTIKEQIGILIQLQAVDSEIYTFTKEKNSAPIKLKAIEDSLESKKAGIKQAEENLKTLQVKLKEKEVVLQQKEEQIQKLQNQLFQLKTNKDYSAMLTEIGGIKADDSLIEEDIIRLMDDIEAAKKKIAEEKDIFKKEEAGSQKEKEQIGLRVKEIDSRLAELSAKRAGMAPGIEKQVMAKYERVLKNKDGLGLVEIEGDSCGGCHMNLPPQVISEVKLREDIIICGSCSRILYIDDNTEIG
ncbi:MAG: C4-type zinc ribbon domain-containing protein [Candidatus Omnitrophota bacterium]